MGRTTDVDAALEREGEWLHRFAGHAHVMVHTVQCEKTLGALRWQRTEGRRIVRRLTGLLGEIEGHGGRAEAREIEQRLLERAGSMAAA